MIKSLLIVSISAVLALSAISADDPAVPQAAYSIIDHNMIIELDLDKNTISAVDKLTLKRLLKKQPGFDLLLRRGLKVEKITCGEVPLEFQTTETVEASLFEAKIDSEDTAYYDRAQMIHIALTDDIVKEKELTIEITYRGVVRDSLGDADFSHEYVSNQITGIIDRRGIYLGWEAIFYPTLPDQIFTFSLKVTTPVVFQCLTEGALEESQVVEDKRTELWVCRHPMDAIHLVGGQYEVGKTLHENIEILTYFYPEQADLSQRYLDACKRYVDLYTELIAPYPFEKFAVVDNFFATGYGMPSFTLLGSQVLRLPFIVDISLGHEVAHNWWGNSVYVDYETGNWCEGLTVYCADYLYKERESLEAAKAYRLDLLRDYTAYTNERNDFALTEFRERHNPAQRAVGYGKCAMFFHMLRNYVTDDDFWRSLQRFYDDNVWNYASWEDVRKAFEKESAMKLGWFFDQWVKQTGAPYLTLNDPQKSRTPGGWELQLTIGQLQEGEPYVLDVPIVVQGTSQEAHLQVGINEKDQTVTLNTIFEPVSFSVDPDFNLFRRLDRSEIPPTLSEVFGTSNLLIVLPTATSEELQGAYRGLAGQLTSYGMENARVLRDDEITTDDLNSPALLFFGRPDENLAVRKEWINSERWKVTGDSFWIEGDDKTAADAALLAVERHPDNSEITVGYFCGNSLTGILEAGRKLKHYGKYSYLVFHAGRNVAKGKWEVSDSKMTYKF
ncbi:hypothetical protein CEE37_12850 [candidate division LCP-89 bacterium B3_LCP]|uniref:Peptidase M1 membrane alanine aminopeptidase domain-containing protein n=1 Tax=candidate division LCP-89 bacterium B3_LCP TaxID=2012998 RepID=A0A532UU67_UNCL8|nr:MAG: hypothetical protein CEE37_12850 [candidate division LCP-89 bacterium B3_LCP]